MVKNGKKMKNEEKYRIDFWNVAGLENKDREFWKSLEKWNVMYLSETWLQKRGGRE